MAAFFFTNSRTKTSAQYRGERWHFITICCHARHSVFASPARARWLIDRLRQQAASHSFAVHAYCLMPDHLHALVMGSDPNSDLLVFVKRLKQKTTYEFRKSAHRALWQKKFYDHNPPTKRFCQPHRRLHLDESRSEENLP